jgi:hypothetical protein
MNRILLASIILSASTGGFLIAHQSAAQLQREAQSLHDAWLVQTQRVGAAQTERASLTERVRDLKQTLAQLPAATENTLWSALQTSRADRLPAELQERLREELGFNWRNSEDYILVSKDAVRQLQMEIFRGDILNDTAATVLALTSEERDRIEAALQRVRTDFRDWALGHVERGEPTDDVVARYSLPSDPAMSESISNNFASALATALGRERMELIQNSARSWMIRVGFLEESRELPVTISVKRYLDKGEPRLQAQVLHHATTGGSDRPVDITKRSSFPAAFRAVFPNGWADIAEREGFELPPPEKK